MTRPKNTFQKPNLEIKTNPRCLDRAQETDFNFLKQVWRHKNSKLIFYNDASHCYGPKTMRGLIALFIH